MEADLRSMMVRDSYGVTESNPINDDIRATREAIEETISLSDRRLGKITRLRLIGDPGLPYLDLSYCYGELKDGTPVRVCLPWYQFNKRNLKGQLIEMSKEVGVFAKGLGLLSPDVISICI
jgi:hypothetical protein